MSLSLGFIGLGDPVRIIFLQPVTICITTISQNGSAIVPILVPVPPVKERCRVSRAAAKTINLLAFIAKFGVAGLRQGVGDGSTGNA
jgi:hypothetical protein